MKNLLVLMALVFGAYYLYTHPRVETVMQPVAMAAPSPAAQPPQRVYFHSPLDAPAMSTSVSTGTGYYSADPNSRFTNYQGGYYSSFQAAGGYPVYTGTTNNTAIINNYGGRAAAASGPVSSGSSYIAGRVPVNASRVQSNADGQRNAYPPRTANY